MHKVYWIKFLALFLRVGFEKPCQYFGVDRPKLHKIQGVVGCQRSKITKIDLFSKNVPNHPDFAPGEYGVPKLGESGPFCPQTVKILYTAPLWSQH